MPTLVVGMFAGVAEHAHGKRGHGTHSFNGHTVSALSDFEIGVVRTEWESRMKIAIASDHAGYDYKEKIKEHLIGLGHEPHDFGTLAPDPLDDYPDYVRPAAEAVARGQYERGIVLGGSGNGEAMTANRVAGVRCTLCWDLKSARFARSHNDANMLSLGQRTIDLETALAIVDCWLETPFDGGRHLRRIRKIDGN